MVESGLVGDSILSRAAYGGGGYGYGGSGNLHGDGSAVNANVTANRDIGVLSAITESQRDNALSGQLRGHRDEIVAGQTRDSQFINDKIDNQSLEFRFANITQQNASMERAAIANQATLVTMMTDNAREAAKCCCEAQLLAVQNQAKTDTGLATLLANQDCANKVADAVANATQNAKLDILLAERGRHGG